MHQQPRTDTHQRVFRGFWPAGQNSATVWHGFSPREAQTNSRIVSLIRGPGVATTAPRAPSKPFWKVSLAFAFVCFSFVLNAYLAKLLKEETALREQFETMLQNERELREELAVQLNQSKATSEHMAKDLEFVQQGMAGMSWRPRGPASSLSNIVQQLLPWPPPHRG